MGRCQDCDPSSYADFVGGVVLGAALGAAAGLLFAPYAGSETRRRLKKEGERVYKDVETKVRPVVKKARKVVTTKVGELKSDVVDAVEEVKGKLKRKK